MTYRIYFIQWDKDTSDRYPRLSVDHQDFLEAETVEELRKEIDAFIDRRADSFIRDYLANGSRSISNDGGFSHYQDHKDIEFITPIVLVADDWDDESAFNVQWNTAIKRETAAR